ncbi:LysR family transcriptional regulator [Klebsiella pneumoniae]|nr:LysR family transcriptional regulator [Klebsiella pneumoniae]HDY9123658.1 LysR family transcriptional regulator [Klebsiella pneumoniae]
MKKPLSSLDLNLLLCLQLLTQELSVTRTAKRMNVSPSAVSKSLAKLRAWFDDPLFVKTPLGLAPTPLVSSMEQDLAAFLRYPHITICWEQRDTWALDDVLQELGYKRNVALTVPGFEQSLFMAAQPQHTMLATAPRYCQHYNQQHQLPLVSRPLPLEAQHLEKLRVPFTLLWHKRNSYNPKLVWLRDTLKALYSGTL